MESPKLKNISVRVKRIQHLNQSLDEARDQISMRRCTVKLLRYNDEELRKMAMVGCSPLKDEEDKPKNIRNMVVRVRRLLYPEIPDASILVQ